jgi:hypothetical protein
MNNITENNKLIAEFMGFKLQQDPTERWFGNYFAIPNDAWSNRLELLHFDTDWNWLMEVVEKIENYNEYTNVLFTPQGCEINCYIENGFLFSNDCNTKIEAVYNACIEFIKWYNKQK